MLRAMASVTPSICWSAAMASSSICLNFVSLMMSSFQPVSCAARRTFWPLRPMASESFSSGTTSSMRPSASSTMTLFTSAGWIAAQTKRAGSRSYGTMSIFSPRSSCTTAWTREPFMPTQAPTGSTSASRLVTAIFERAPGSRAHGDDADDALVDLGHLGLEELLDEACGSLRATG